MIAITGGNGALGTRVVAALAAAGEGPFVVGTRSGTLVDPPVGAIARTADFDDPATLESAFAGVSTVLLISTGAPVDRRIAQHRAAVDAALAAGVSRVVYTSFIDHEADSPFPFAAVHADTEASLAASGIPFLVLRNGQYADRFVEFLPSAAAQGVLRLPIAADAAPSFIGRDDLAEAAVAALLRPELTGTLTLTGAARVSYREVAALMAEAAGVPIRFETSTPEEYRAGLLAESWPVWEADAFTFFFDAVAEGRTATLTRDAEQLLGREPLSLREILRRATAAGAGELAQ